jgi:GUN4-like/Caspase domain
MANNWAIAVGINDYEFLPEASLSFAAADALAIQQFLCQDAGFSADQVLLCGNGLEGTRKATFPMLRDILQYQLERARNADNLWFFFGGHGTVGEDQQDYLLASDSNPRDLLHTAIPINFVIDRLRACKAKNIVLVLDMCRSERLQTGQRDLGWVEDSVRQSVQEREGQQGIITLFSCGRGQSSYEIAELQQGAFTYALLEGLRRHSILKDLGHFLEKRVPELHRLHGAAGQTRRQVPLVIPEPGWKYDEPILSHYATAVDVSRLKEMAIDAECDGDIDKALRLWEQIILLPTISTADRQRALKKIRDLMGRSSQSSETSEAPLEIKSSPLAESPRLPLAREALSPLSPVAAPTPKIPEGIDAVSLVSEKGVDYRNLRDLLKAEKWREADEETVNVMLQASKCESGGLMDADSLKNFPCQDLKTIDQLWVKASDSHFGFSVQKKIWRKCGRPMSYNNDCWDKFCDRVGWRAQGELLIYSDLKFAPAPKGFSPKGELPGLLGVTGGILGLVDVGLGVGFWLVPLFSRKDL